MRTNPRLTGNVKITIDSDEQIWLNSIDSDPALSSERFKRFKIEENSDYSKDLFKFFDNGAFPRDLVFKVADNVSDEFTVSSNYTDQYNFLYSAGVSSLDDPKYKEDFSYFAPIDIGKELPDYFVVFRLDGPISYKYNTNSITIESGKRYKLIKSLESTDYTIEYDGKIYSSGEYLIGNNISFYTIISGSGNVVLMDEISNIDFVNNNETYFRDKILPNLKAIKTFNLKEGTHIGDYIRNIINNPGYKDSLIDASFNSTSYTYFNGISYNNGIFSSYGENLSTYYSDKASTPQIDFEEFITDGFKRNGIISSKILNLEFLFDDNADLYSINRYLGFYVNEIELSSLTLSGDLLWKNKQNSLNLPIPNKNIYGYYNDPRSFQQYNKNGIELYYENADGFLPGFNDVNTLEYSKLFYLKDINNQFHNLKRYEPGSSIVSKYGPIIDGIFSATGSSGATSGNLIIQDSNIDLINLTGFNKESISIFSGQNKTSGQSFGSITFKSVPTNIDCLRFYNPFGVKNDGIYRYDEFFFNDLSSVIGEWSEGDYYSQDGINYISNLGKMSDFLSALSKSINYNYSNILESVIIDNTIIIKSIKSGEIENLMYSFLYISDNSEFKLSYKGIFSEDNSYNKGDIVRYDNNLWISNSINNTKPSEIPNINVTYTGDLVKNSNYITNLSSNSELTIDQIVNSEYIPTGSVLTKVNASSVILSNVSNKTVVSSSINFKFNNWSKYNTCNQEDLLLFNNVDASTTFNNSYFTGGTDNYNNRFYINSTDLYKIKNKWVSTKAGYSEIKYSNNYIDEPIYDSNGILTGFKNFTEYTSVVIDDVNSDLLIDQSNQVINLYEVFKPKLGIFSFFNVSDFDFSFWTSNYGNAPYKELDRYFGLSPLESKISPNVPYYVAAGEIIYNGEYKSEGTTFNGGTGSNFYTVSQNSKTNPIVIPSWYLDDENLSSLKFESDLDSFSGFSGITNLFFNPISGNSKLEKIKSGILDNEYDYLAENYTKERTYKSRVTPYINKWGYLNGSDSRVNPYRYNSSLAFGFSNFSPFLNNYSQDPKLITHEWFLLENLPIDFPLNSIENTYSYLPYDLDLSKLSDSNPNGLYGDYFSNFFTVDDKDYGVDPVTGLSNNKINTKELFTILNYNKGSGYYEALFKGLKYQFLEKSINNNNNIIQNSRKYENYKFSCILRVVDEDLVNIQSPVTFEFIENETYKNITFVITLVFRDYRGFPLEYIYNESMYGGIINDLGVTGTTGSVIDYTLLYSLNSKKKLEYDKLDEPAPYSTMDSIKLSVALDLSSKAGSNNQGSFVNQDGGYVFGINNSEYPWDLRDEINLVFPTGTGPNNGYFLELVNKSKYPQPSGSFREGINFLGIDPLKGYEFNLGFSPIQPTYLPKGKTFFYKDKPIFQVAGGIGFFESIMSKLSASYVRDLINSGSNYIKYNTYRYVNGENVKISNLLSSKILETSILYKSGDYEPVPDKNVPDKLKSLNRNIGYNLVNNNTISYQLNRYNGPYDPLYKKVIRFKNQKDSTLTNYPIDLSFTNCDFGYEKYGFGNLVDLSFRKITSSGDILDVNKSSGYNPSYNLVDQVTIDKKDFSIFTSSWDPGFLRSWTSSNIFENKAGTRNFKEAKSFFGSKSCQLPKEISISTFISMEISIGGTGSSNYYDVNTSARDMIGGTVDSSGNISLGNLPVINSPSGKKKFDENIFPDIECFYNVTDSYIEGTLRVDRMLKRSILSNGLKNTFYKYIVSDFGIGDFNSIEDDVISYIEQNILNLYEISNVYVYVKSSNGILDSIYTPIRSDMNSSQKIQNGYFVNKNAIINTKDTLIREFSFRKETGKTYSLTFSFDIKRI